MRSRLRKGGVEVTGFARTREVSDVDTIEEMVSKISSPRIVWVEIYSIYQSL
jgi:6-phosphogluconate dehydrogenase